MNMLIDQPKDLDLLNRVGISLYRLIVKARTAMGVSESASDQKGKASPDWTEETAIGCEASWSRVFCEPE